MDSLRWIAVVLSMILGLGVTRLLSGIVEAFKARHRSRIDWVPLIWAACVFLIQLQFWWALFDIPAEAMRWTFTTFLALIFPPAMLFLAPALLLPSNEPEKAQGLRAYFEDAGRWALLPLSLYFVAAFLVNVWFFQAAPLAPWGGVDIVLVVLPLAVLVTRVRIVHVIATLLYVPAVFADIWLTSDVY